MEAKLYYQINKGNKCAENPLREIPVAQRSRFWAVEHFQSTYPMRMVARGGIDQGLGCLILVLDYFQLRFSFL